ncbi:MAG TPA: radical SAM protein [Symbiobacteriaceae bacterium]|nr:radical SAM protein [Symbiobacteriaceae bacterium]
MNLTSMDSGELLRKALSGEKLFPDEAIALCENGELLDLAMAAREVARRLHPTGSVGYAVSKTVVYSNVCQPNCPFCTGTVTRDDPAAFTKSAGDVTAEVAEAVVAGATQITLQGGHRIDLPWEYYTGLVRTIHDRFPAMQIFAYSPTEIMVFNVAYQKSTREVIAELKAAGMGALLAGGAETMTTRIPEYRALLRGPWNEWFDVVHRCADADIPVVVPFVFGLGEPLKERVGHLYRTRAVQDRTLAAKKPAFVALTPFTLTGGVTGHEYLRVLALARVLVQNVPHVQASFVTQGAKVAQVALDGGADDLGGTHMEFAGAELAAGRTGAMTAAEMERLISEAGRIPQLRTAW